MINTCSKLLRALFIVGFMLTSLALAQQTTITYAFWDLNQRPAMEAQAKAFEESHPDIRVELQVVPWDQYWTKLQTSVAGGAAYDVFWMNSRNFSLYASQGVLADLSSLFINGEIDADSYPQSLIDLYTYQGDIYAVPKDFDTIALFYNKALFDEAGVEYPTAEWTWSDLRDAAEKLTIREGNRTRQFGFAARPDFRTHWPIFVYQNGGRVLNEDGTRVLLNEPEACEAILFLYDFQNDGLAPGGAELQAQNWDTDANLFPAGKIAMTYSGSWRASPFHDADPNIEVAPLPHGEQRVNTINGLGNVVWANSPNKDAAMEFVKFLGSQQAQQIQAETGTVIPAMLGLQDIWVDATPDMNLQVFINEVEHAVPLPTSPRGPEWDNTVTQTLREAWLGTIPRDQICQTVTDRANTALSR